MKINQWGGWKVRALVAVFAISLSTLAHAATVYVDAARGFDVLDGSTNVVISATQGPKRSITTAITLASSGSTIVIAGGYYPEMTGPTTTVWDVRTKDLSLLPLGDVKIADDASTVGDGIPDWWKTLNGLSLTSTTLAAAVSTNAWAHGLTWLQVYQNPSVLVSDGFSTLHDGLADWWKIREGLSLLDASVSNFVSGLVGWWKLDEGSGTNAFDSSFNGSNGFNVFDGSLAGSPLPQWTNGVSSNALWFCGSNSVQVANAALLSPTNALTLLAWVQVSSNISGSVVSKWTTNISPAGYSLGFTNSQVAFSLSLSGTVVSLVGATTNWDGGWHFIAGVYDSSQMTVYLDGAEDASVSVSGAVDVVSAPLVIGQQLAGTINDVHLYSRALSANELANYSTLDDGLPDWWKVAYGFSITDPTVAGDDPLGDGISNLIAYQYGMDPWVTESSYVMINGGASYATNSLATIDPSLSPFPLLLVSLFPTMADAMVLSNAFDSYLLTNSVTTNVTFYFQYETASTNAVGNEFTETVTVDRDSPVVAFLPGWGGTNTLSDPLLRIFYTDPVGADTNVAPSGLNLSTLAIILDGNDVTTNFYIFPSMATGDATAAPTGWHTNIISLADNAGNWTFATNVFFTTGTNNPAAPMMSSLDLDEDTVTLMPDVPEVWVQGKVSGSGSSVSAIVNGGTPIPMNRRDDDFGYLLPLDPGTNVIVLTSQDPSGNQSSKTLLINRTQSFQAAISSPAFGTFANGSAQWVSGSVGSYTLDDGSVLTLSSLMLNGEPLAGAVPGGSFGTNVPPPCSVMPLIISACWTGTTFAASYTNICADLPLGLLEGYEITRKQASSWTSGGGQLWVWNYWPGQPCWDEWYTVQFRTGYEFDQSCALLSSNAQYTLDEVGLCSSSGAVGSNNLVNWSGWQYQPGWPAAGIAAVGLDGRGLGLGFEYVNWPTVFPTNPHDGDVVAYALYTEDGTLTYRAPFYYGSNTMVLLTLEGMVVNEGFNGFWGQTQDWSTVNLVWEGTSRAPVAITTNRDLSGNLAADVSYLVAMDGGKTNGYEFSAATFAWPTLTNIWTDGSSVFTDTPPHTLTFSGFHNFAATLKETAPFSGFTKDQTTGDYWLVVPVNGANDCTVVVNTTGWPVTVEHVVENNGTVTATPSPTQFQVMKSGQNSYSLTVNAGSVAGDAVIDIREQGFAGIPSAKLHVRVLPKKEMAVTFIKPTALNSSMTVEDNNYAQNALDAMNSVWNKQANIFFKKQDPFWQGVDVMPAIWGSRLQVSGALPDFTRVHDQSLKATPPAVINKGTLPYFLVALLELDNHGNNLYGDYLRMRKAIAVGDNAAQSDDLIKCTFSHEAGHHLSFDINGVEDTNFSHHEGVGPPHGDWEQDDNLMHVPYGRHQLHITYKQAKIANDNIP